MSTKQPLGETGRLSEGSRPGAQRLAVSRGSREIFPLPLLADDSVFTCSGRSRRRQNRRSSQTRSVNDALSALNWLAGRKDGSSTVASTDVGMHAEVVRRVEGLVRSQEPPLDAPSPLSAFKELVGTRGIYEDPGGLVSLAPFKSDLVSLPASTESSPLLWDLLASEDRDI